MDFYCAAPPKKNGRRKKAHVKVLPTLGQPGEDLLAAPGRTVLLLLNFCWIWASRHVLPKEKVHAHRKKALAPTLIDLAAAYDCLR